MATLEHPTFTIEGHYRDVLRAPTGEAIWDRGWKHNAINVSCRQLIASFMRGTPAALGITGLALGAGSETWDLSAPPQPTPTSTLVDKQPWVIPKASLTLDFLDGGTVVASATNRLQIVAQLGPHVPDWPGPGHTTSSLREFALVGQLNGKPALINYVTHPVITKDPESTLERTIWLVF